MILKVCWDGLWTLSFGLSQFHGHGSWLMCEVALSLFHASLPTTICGSIFHEFNGYDYAGVLGETTITNDAKPTTLHLSGSEAHNIVALKNMESSQHVVF